MVIFAADDPVLAFLIVGGVIALVVVGIAWAIWAEKKRTEQLKAAAEAMGFQFLPGSRALPSDEIGHFEIFSKGRSRQVLNLMQAATEDLRTSIFDYRYTTGSGKHSQTHHQTAIHLESNDLDLPAFVLRPEGWLAKIGGMLGFQDINFNSHPQFSSMFQLKGSDEAAIRNAFHNDLLSFLEGQKGLSMDAAGRHLVVYRASRRLAPGDLQEFLGLAFRIRSLLAASRTARGNAPSP